MLRSIFNEYNGDENFVFEREEVFLYEYDFPFHLPSCLYLKYIENTSCKEQEEAIPIKKKNILY